MWKALGDYPKRQQITTLQLVFDDMARRLGVRDPIVSTPDPLKMNLYLRFHFYHRDDLGTGIHQL